MECCRDAVIIVLVGCVLGVSSFKHREQPPADFVSLSSYSTAVCLDGTPAGYYVRPGSGEDSNRFLVYFEGGGWCYDESCEEPTIEGTLKNCAERSQTRLGSSKSWESSRNDFTGMLSADDRDNPLFHGYTLVYVPYCDGTSFSGERGDSPVSGLHFRGHSILSALVTDLKATHNIAHASEVVLSGSSAGGTSVLWHADWIFEQLALSSGVGVALVDAGFFVDHEDKDNIDCWSNQMRSMAQVSGALVSSTLHGGCLARFVDPTETWRCLFPQYYGDLIRTPTFLLQALYDSSELYSTLRLECSATGSLKKKCSGKELSLFRKMKAIHLDAWRDLVHRAGNGVWAPACITHSLSRKAWSNRRWTIPGNSSNTAAVAVGQWLAGLRTQGLPPALVIQDEVAWPLNRGCSGSD